ncbi:MAG: hypothetical protein FRX49_08095 [Trebouxia sp. A1-2]|nr:MAG: hypothetical protein FRX49_08095 [Trebouxia sp. A1-2]
MPHMGSSHNGPAAVASWYPCMMPDSTLCLILSHPGPIESGRVVSLWGARPSVAEASDRPSRKGPQLEAPQDPQDPPGLGAMRSSFPAWLTAAQQQRLAQKRDWRRWFQSSGGSLDQSFLVPVTRFSAAIQPAYQSQSPVGLISRISKSLYFFASGILCQSSPHRSTTRMFKTGLLEWTWLTLEEGSGGQH